MSSSLEITPELLAGFLDEAPEYLDTLDAGLLEFESHASAGVVSLDTPEDQECMNGMFRAAHSLKGLAAAFGFDRIKELTHRMETLFDQVRMRKRDLTSRSFETLFQVFDRLKALVRELSDPAAQPIEIADVLSALDEILGESAAPPVLATVSSEHLPATPEQCASGTAESSVTREVFGDPELAAAFVETTVEAVEELNEGLLGLERDAESVDLLNKVFRCAHNIKGASGAAGLTNMNRLTHEMETVFDLLRSKRISLTDELMNVVFATVDRLRASIEQIRDGHVTDAANDGLIDRLRAFSAASRPAPSAQRAPVSALHQETTPPAAGSGQAGIDDRCANGFGSDGVLQVVVRFDEGFGEAPIHAYLIYNKLTDLGEVLSSDPDMDAIGGDTAVTTVTFRIRAASEPDALRSLLSTYGAAEVRVTAESGSLEADASCGPERAHQLEPSAVAVPSTSEAPAVESAHKPAPDTSSHPEELVAEIVEAMASRIGATQTNLQTTVRDGTPVPPAAEWGGNGPGTSSPQAVGGVISAASGSKSPSKKPEATAQKTGETLRVDQERLDQLMNLGGELVINRARFTQVNGKLRGLLGGKSHSYAIEEIEDRLRQLSSTVDAMSAEGGAQRDQDHIRSQLTHLRHSFQTVRGVLEQVHDARAAMVDFDEALHALGRVSEGLQKGIMGTRMVPIGPLFNRFRRVVRDISKSNGKQVDLVLKGENTELDKRMIDELGDPLTHMVRNSVDHGLELPEARIAAGKNPVGTVTLDAHHRGNSICIEVKDDGAGIHLERVKAKILEKQLATSEQLQKMSDREIIQYILRPGFSTAPVVTDLSGRGMGMDIVVNKIEKLSGTMEIDSTPGQGTKITIKLPLTIAILTSMVARIGRGVYALPLESVAEIITVRRTDIQLVQRREVVQVRERIIPLVHFEDIFGTSLQGLCTESRGDAELTLVLVGLENDKVGLVVDELLGQDDVVIKSVAENYRNVRGVAGASIRGDGTVSLILDVAAMTELAGKIEPQKIDSRKVEPIKSTGVRPTSSQRSAPAEV